MTDITADVSLVGALEIETDVRGVRGESAYAIAVRNGFVGTEEEWLASLKGSPGDPGQDGHSPVITATKSNGTTTVKVDGVTVATINDGEDGHSPVISASKSGKITTITADGTVIATINDGQDGQDGHSPVITTSKSGKTTTILSDGTSIGTILDGEDGQDGVTPSFSIGRVQSGQSAAASITGTDANPVLNLTLPKGDDGQAGQGIPTGGTAGQVLKKSSGTDYDAEWADESGAVTDVQINGTSILNNGVANVPVAGAGTMGAVQVSGYGLTMQSNGYISTKAATNSEIKAGTRPWEHISPQTQHQSTFYGLAKASGDTTQSQSSNAVGVYTDSAKVAIQKMLGIYEAPWELIADETASEDITEFNITTDTNGEPFELKKMIVVFSAGQSTTGTRDVFYTAIRERYGTANNTMSMPSFTYPSATSAMVAKTEIATNNGAPVSVQSVISSSDGSTNMVQSMPKYNIVDAITAFKIYQSGSTKSLIPSGANIKIYGIRL